MNGFLLIDKPASWTSRDVCNRIQHLFHTKKVGHTGTLDPFATGLLIVTLGNATKAGLYLENEDKEYIAELKLGTKTSTGDFTGDVLEEKQVPNLTINDIECALKSLEGKQIQIPPMTSARHYKGQQLYKLAHKGITVERDGKEITVYKICLISYENNILKFKTTVSKGTYIRVLGEDIAMKLGTYGNLINLRRTKIGGTSVEDSISLDLVNESNLKNIVPFLEKAYKTFVVDRDLEKKIKAGLSLRLDTIENLVFFKNQDDCPLAIYERNGETYKCKRGLW